MKVATPPSLWTGPPEDPSRYRVELTAGEVDVLAIERAQLTNP